MKRDVTASSDNTARTAGKIALERFHPQVVTHEPAIETDPLANDVLNDSWRKAGGTLAVPRRVDHVGGHPHRCRRQAFERFEVGLKLLGTGGDDGKPVMAIDERAPMTRHMLDDADDAAGSHAVENGAA